MNDKNADIFFAIAIILSLPIALHFFLKYSPVFLHAKIIKLEVRIEKLEAKK